MCVCGIFLSTEVPKLSVERNAGNIRKGDTIVGTDRRGRGGGVGGCEAGMRKEEE